MLQYFVQGYWLICSWERQTTALMALGGFQYPRYCTTHTYCARFKLYSHLQSYSYHDIKRHIFNYDTIFGCDDMYSVTYATAGANRSTIQRPDHRQTNIGYWFNISHSAFKGKCGRFNYAVRQADKCLPAKRSGKSVWETDVHNAVSAITFSGVKLQCQSWVSRK